MYFMNSRKSINSYSMFSALYDETTKHQENKVLPKSADWRFITSGVVTRPQYIIDGPTERASEESKSPEKTKNEFFMTPPSWTDTLRKPARFPKARKNLEDDSNSSSKMTRNCEQLFSQMQSTFTWPSQKCQVDPSLSVRRIVKGSGLLQAFGTGLLNDNELEQSVCGHDYTANSESPELTSRMNTSFDVNAFMASSVPETHPNNYAFREQNRSSSPIGSCTTDNGSTPETSPKNYLHPSCNYYSNISPVIYDTVLMQKTIETEVVEYLPLDESNSSEPQRFPTRINKKRQAPICEIYPLATKRRKRCETQKLNNHTSRHSENDDSLEFDETTDNEKRYNKQLFLKLPLF